MEVSVVPLPTLDRLRDYVRQTLCERDRLDPEQAQLRQALVQRAAHRLASEPGRLWRRYLVGNPKFVAGVAADLLRGERSRARRER